MKKEVKDLEPVTPPPTDLAAIDGDNWSVADPSLIPVKMPVMKLAQGTSADRPPDCQIGWYYIPALGMVLKDPTVLLLDVTIKKTKWVEPFDPGAKGVENLLCCSDDGIIPTGRGSAPQHGPCRKYGATGLQPFCPDAHWKQEGEKNIPPRCSDDVTCLLWLVDQSIPVFYRTRKAGAPEIYRAKQALEAAKLRVVDPARPDVYARMIVPFRLSSQSLGRYYIPQMAMLEEKVDPNLSFAVAKAFKELRAHARLVTVEDLYEEQDADGDHGRTPF